MLVSVGYSKIILHIGRTFKQGIYVLTVLEARTLKSRCLHAWFFLEALERTCLMLLSWLPVVAGPSWAFAGLWMQHPNLCLHLHVASSPLCAYVSMCPSLLRMSVVLFRAPPNSVWPEFNLTNYVCKDPASKSHHIVKFQVGMSFGLLSLAQSSYDLPSLLFLMVSNTS